MVLGCLLECDEFILNSIEREGSDAMSCLQKMLSNRLKKIDPPLSWELVAEAVEVLNPQQAQAIRQQYHTN